LAAERGTPEFTQLRDQLLLELTDDERSRSDVLYRELRRQYHDLAVLLSSIKRHKRALRNRNLRDLGQPTSTFSPRGNRMDPEYYEQLAQELEQQLRMLAELGDFPDIETDPDAVDIEEIEGLVAARIEQLSD
jgi:hypothetical protein